MILGRVDIQINHKGCTSNIGCGFGISDVAVVFHELEYFIAYLLIAYASCSKKLGSPSGIRYHVINTMSKLCLCLRYQVAASEAGRLSV